MTIDYIKSLTTPQLLGMSDADIKATLTQAAKIANARIERIEQTGIPSYAVQYNERYGGKFEVGSERVENIDELKRAIKFLTAKTSTITGAKSAVEKQERRTAAYMTTLGVDYQGWSVEERREFWKIFNLSSTSISNTIESIWGRDKYLSREAIAVAANIYKSYTGNLKDEVARRNYFRRRFFEISKSLLCEQAAETARRQEALKERFFSDIF